MQSFLDYIRFKYIPCDVLVKEVFQWNVISCIYSDFGSYSCNDSFPTPTPTPTPTTFPTPGLPPPIGP